MFSDGRYDNNYEQRNLQFDSGALSFNVGSNRFGDIPGLHCLECRGQWLYRLHAGFFNFGGGGSLVFEIKLRGMRRLVDGEIGVSFSHSQYGSGEIVLNEDTLEPKAVREYAYPYPEELNEVTISGAYAKEIETRINRLGNYLLRWETMGASNDRKPSGPLPPPIMLEVIELEPTR